MFILDGKLLMFLIMMCIWGFVVFFWYWFFVLIYMIFVNWLIIFVKICGVCSRVGRLWICVYVGWVSWEFGFVLVLGLKLECYGVK